MLRTELIEQGRRTRAAILAAAAEEFATHGYDAASLSAIGARAGKDKAALRHHFATKAELARGVDDYQYAVWQPMVCAVADSGARGLPAVLALMSDAIDDSVATPFARAVIRLRVGTLPADVTLSIPVFSWFDVIVNRMVQAQEDGDLPHSADPRTTARLLIDTSFGVHQLNFSPTDSATASDQFSHLWHHILLGVGVADPGSVLAAAASVRESIRPLNELGEPAHHVDH